MGSSSITNSKSSTATTTLLSTATTPYLECPRNCTLCFQPCACQSSGDCASLCICNCTRTFSFDDFCTLCRNVNETSVAAAMNRSDSIYRCNKTNASPTCFKQNCSVDYSTTGIACSSTISTVLSSIKSTLTGQSHGISTGAPFDEMFYILLGSISFVFISSLVCITLCIVFGKRKKKSALDKTTYSTVGQQSSRSAGGSKQISDASNRKSVANRDVGSVTNSWPTTFSALDKSKTFSTDSKMSALAKQVLLEKARSNFLKSVAAKKIATKDTVAANKNLRIISAVGAKASVRSPAGKLDGAKSGDQQKLTDNKKGRKQKTEKSKTKTGKSDKGRSPASASTAKRKGSEKQVARSYKSAKSPDSTIMDARQESFLASGKSADTIVKTVNKTTFGTVRTNTII